MAQVYLVSSGCYSDYSIDAVFTTRELAQDYIDKYKDDCWDEPRIETMELNPGLEQTRAGMEHLRVRMNKDGRVLEVMCERPGKSWLGSGIWGPSDDNASLSMVVWATDQQHAIKIVNERRAFLVANDLWMRGDIS